MIVWPGWTLPPLLTAPGMSRGPSALRFRSHSLAGSRQIFYCISTAQIHFIRLFLEIPGIWSKDFWGQNCTFCGDLKWMSRPLLLDSRPVLSLTPFLQDLVLSSCCMIRGAGGMRKCWFYPKWLWLDDVRWSDTMTDQNFKRVSDDSGLCAVLTENDPCVRY